LRWRWPLYLLAAFLFAWEPLRVAGEVMQSLSTMGMRGAPALFELTAHAAIAAVSVAAAWSLWNGSTHGTKLAVVALVLSAAASVQSVYWSRLPRQTPPGAELPVAAIAVVHASGWILYLLLRPRTQPPPTESTRFFQ
jgi:hypothetical protein